MSDSQAVALGYFYILSITRVLQFSPVSVSAVFVILYGESEIELQSTPKTLGYNVSLCDLSGSHRASVNQGGMYNTVPLKEETL